jgi:hypothetical protein
MEAGQTGLHINEKALASCSAVKPPAVHAAKSPRANNRNKKAAMTYDAEYELINGVRYVKVVQSSLNEHYNRKVLNSFIIFA